MSVESARVQIESFPEQFQEYELSEEIKESLNKINVENLKGIVIAGMGGSALSGEVLKNYLESINFHLPLFIVRQYELPSFVDKNYLVFIQSYSGNTEETISCLKDAFRKRIPSIVISSNGIIKDLAKKYETPYIEMPQHWQPRLAIGFFLMREFAVLNYLFGLDYKKELEHIRKIKWDKLKSIAEKLIEKVELPLILYSSYAISSVPFLWKALINECSKRLVFVNLFSELNHNEMVGYTLDRDYYVLIFQDEDDHYRIKKRIDLLQKIFKKLKVDSLVLSLKGSSFLSRIISLIYIGMWFAFNLAIENDQDPEEVRIIEEFKKKLGRFV